MQGNERYLLNNIEIIKRKPTKKNHSVVPKKNLLFPSLKINGSKKF